MQFLLSSLSVFPLTYSAMDIAVGAGYDGIEVFVFRFFGFYPDFNRYRYEAHRRGLKLQFHESWDWNGDVTHLSCRIPALWGGLIPSGHDLKRQFGDAKEVVVTRAERWREAAWNPDRNWYVQTCSVIPDGNYKTSYAEFMQAWQDHQFPVVFDTQHFLEFQQGKPGIEHLTLNRKELLARLVRGFQVLRTSIREIHLNDCDPQLGHELGRNVPIGRGILPLKEFCEEVRKSGWDGTVVPEVHPRHFARFSQGENIRRAAEELLRAKLWMLGG